MYSTLVKRTFIPIALISLLLLIGCSGMEFAPKKGIWYYPSELPQAERAVEGAKTAGKDKTCPAEFDDAKKLKDSAYETFWSCNTKKAIEMAKDASKRAAALCPCEKKKPGSKEACNVLDRFTLTINFAFNKAKITKHDAIELKKAIAFIKKYPGAKIRLEGNTDSIGTEKYNMKLSEKRADATKAYLVRVGHADASKISTLGYGESKPVASNKTRKGRAQNRRVEILILRD